MIIIVREVVTQASLTYCMRMQRHQAAALHMHNAMRTPSVLHHIGLMHHERYCPFTLYNAKLRPISLQVACAVLPVVFQPSFVAVSPAVLKSSLSTAEL